MNIFNIPAKESRDNSLFFNPIANLVPGTIDFVLGDQSKTKDLFQEYIEGTDESPINGDIIDTTGVPIN